MRNTVVSTWRWARVLGRGSAHPRLRPAVYLIQWKQKAWHSFVASLGAVIDHGIEFTLHWGGCGRQCNNKHLRGKVACVKQACTELKPRSAALSVNFCVYGTSQSLHYSFAYFYFAARDVVRCITCCKVMQPCINGEVIVVRETAKFHHSQNRSPLTDYRGIWNRPMPKSNFIKKYV